MGDNLMEIKTSVAVIIAKEIGEVSENDVCIMLSAAVKAVKVNLTISGSSLDDIADAIKMAVPMLKSSIVHSVKVIETERRGLPRSQTEQLAKQLDINIPHIQVYVCRSADEEEQEDKDATPSPLTRQRSL